MDILPLLCANCGRVLEWAQAATDHRLRCPQCRARTSFTIREGKVHKQAIPDPVDFDRLMRESIYPDWRKC